MRIGIIGAGMIGSTLAKLWVDAGHDVRLASVIRYPAAACPGWEGARRLAPAESANFGTSSCWRFRSRRCRPRARSASALMGKGGRHRECVRQRDGQAAREATEHPSGSAGWAAAMFSGAVGKGFNTVYARCLSVRRTAAATAWAFARRR
jgi:hypothetical protein